VTDVFSLTEVSKHFGRVAALDRVSLTGQPGQVFALLGENGAGKTTAIRILLGLLQPDAGRATVLGMESTLQGEEIRRRVGYVPDRPTLYEWMTVGEIGWFASGFYPSGYLAKYREMVAQYRLPEDRRVRDLSKGMQAKVSLALAMAHEPPLLVLDEPTSGLDPLVRREFLEGMVDVAATGRTVLLSSHQMNEVERVADVVAILREGTLVLCAPLQELKEQVRELTVTEHDISRAPPELPPETTLLAAQRQDRSWRMLVRDAPADITNRLRGQPNVAHALSRTPTLEEIFVVVMHPDRYSVPAVTDEVQPATRAQEP